MTSQALAYAAPSAGGLPDQVTDRASAAAFVDGYVAPYAGGFEREAHIPDTTLAQISGAGLWAPFLPVALGGQGMSWSTLAEVHEEVGRGCSAVRSMLTVQTMVAWVVNRWGSTEQRARWCPGLASGEVVASFGLTEPAAGSSTGDLAATARRTTDGWVLDGSKCWITSAQRADLFLVFARVEGTVAAFLVPRSAAGLTVEPITEMLGTVGSMLGKVQLDGVTVGADALVGPSGFTSGMLVTGALDLGRLSVASGCVGILQACLDASADYTSTRVVDGMPLRERQLIRAKVSDMVTDVRAARLLVAEAARLKDLEDPATLMATWVAKYFSSTAAARHASEAVQIHGANGCGADYPTARLYRDAKVMELIEGSNEIQRLTIADEAYRGRAR